MFQTNVTAALSRPLSRSVSEYSLRDRASFRSFPSDFPAHQLISSSSPTYFCTYCNNGFKSRADWETHEWLFHERQSYWPCPYPGCESIFDSGSSFETHHEARHRCLNCKHAAEVVRLLPERKAWACGFDLCKAVFVDWSKRCKHVSSHYEGLARRHGLIRDTPQWTYSTSMRNLLRLPEVRDSFKRFMVKCHGSSKSAWPRLEWQREDTGELRRCLEYRDFRRGVPEVIHMAYRLGHPAYNAAMRVMTSPPSPPSLQVSRSNSRLRRPSSSASDVPSSSVSGSPHRLHRPYLYERQPLLSTLPEWEPLSPRVHNAYSLPHSLASSPPDASPPRTRNVSPIRTASLNTQISNMRSVPRKRMVAREADVRGTGCAALIQFLRQGPPDGGGCDPPRVTEHDEQTFSTFQPPVAKEHTERGQTQIQEASYHSSVTGHEQTQMQEEVLASSESVESQDSQSRRFPVAPPGSPTLSISLTASDAPSLTPTPLSLWPSPITLSVWPASDPVHQDPHAIIQQLASLPPPLSKSSLAAPPASPLPDMTGMDWPLPPPSSRATSRATSRASSPAPPLNSPFPRPATSAGEHTKRPSFSSRGKGRSLRWVSISGIAEPPMSSPGVDFGSCLSQPLDLLQPVSMA
jgi:hypothetical protein